MSYTILSWIYSGLVALVSLDFSSLISSWAAMIYDYWDLNYLIHGRPTWKSNSQYFSVVKQALFIYSLNIIWLLAAMTWFCSYFFRTTLQKNHWMLGLSFQVSTRALALLWFDANILIIILSFSIVIHIGPLTLEFCGELANNWSKLMTCLIISMCTYILLLKYIELVI